MGSLIAKFDARPGPRHVWISIQKEAYCLCLLSDRTDWLKKQHVRVRSGHTISALCLECRGMLNLLVEDNAVFGGQVRF